MDDKIMNDKVKITVYIKAEEKKMLDELFVFYMTDETHGPKRSYGEIVGSGINDLHDRWIY